MVAGHRTMKGWQRRIGTVSNHGNLAQRQLLIELFKPLRGCPCGPERFFVEMAEHLLASLYQVGSLNIRHSTLIEVCQTRRSLALFQQSVSKIQGSLDFPKPRTTDAMSEMSES